MVGGGAGADGVAGGAQAPRGGRRPGRRRGPRGDPGRGRSGTGRRCRRRALAPPWAQSSGTRWVSRWCRPSPSVPSITRRNRRMRARRACCVLAGEHGVAGPIGGDAGVGEVVLAGLVDQPPLRPRVHHRGRGHQLGLVDRDLPGLQRGRHLGALDQPFGGLQRPLRLGLGAAVDVGLPGRRGREPTREAVGLLRPRRQRHLLGLQPADERSPPARPPSAASTPAVSAGSVTSHHDPTDATSSARVTLGVVVVGPPVMATTVSVHQFDINYF